VSAWCALSDLVLLRWLSFAARPTKPFSPSPRLFCQVGHLSVQHLLDCVSDTEGGAEALIDCKANPSLSQRTEGPVTRRVSFRSRSSSSLSCWPGDYTSSSG
jgi:hypothetical protein